MLYCARHAWHAQRRRVLFVPLEMEVMQILTRLVGMEVGIEARSLRTGSVSTREQRRVRELTYADHEPFWVVDAQLSLTVPDLRLLCRQLRPDIVYVDGAYLLQHPDPRIGFYTRVAANVNDLKHLAVESATPLFCSWQFNTEATKEIKKGGTPGLEGIAHAREIAFVSRVVLSMFEAETIATQRRRQVHVSKGREGEEGEFLVHWDWRRMDFSQVEIEPPAESFAG